MRRLMIWGLVVMVGAAWFTRAHWAGAQQGDEIQFAEVVRGPLRMKVQTTGPLRPVKSVPVGSEISGTVAWMGVDFNDRVKKGQVLARLGTELFESRLAQAQASHDNAMAAQKKAEIIVANLRQTLPMLTELADWSVKNAEAAYEIAEFNWKRIDALYEAGDAPEAEWRDARAKYDTARAAERRAQINLRQAQLDETIQVQQVKQDVALAKAAADQAKASLELAQRDLDRCTIRAPIDGIILKRLVNEGEPVISALTAQHIFIIAPDLVNMQLYANVSESDIGLVDVGQEAEFTVDACGERRFSGKVTMVRNDPMIMQGVVTYQVLVDVDNSEELLKPEMTANVAIEVVHRESVAKVDNAALRFRPSMRVDDIQELTKALDWPALERSDDSGAGGAAPTWASKALLWQRESGRWMPVPVWIGITDNHETEILAGAGEGDRFIVSFISRTGVVGSFKQAIELANPSNRSL
ncbi:MAG: efflux RND transporter periplasmic adaptor subunit [Phycisphaerae bacterium]